MSLPLMKVIPSIVTFPLLIDQCGNALRALIVKLDRLEASIVKSSMMVCGPVVMSMVAPSTAILKLIVSAPADMFANAIVSRSDPEPELFAFVTVNVALYTGGIRSEIISSVDSKIYGNLGKNRI